MHRIFATAQPEVPTLLAQSAWDNIHTPFSPAKPPLHGTAPTKLSPNASKAISSFAAMMPAYAMTGKRKAVAEATGMTIITVVPDAGMPTTMPRTVLKHRKLKVLALYKPDAWESLLCKAGLFATYHWIPDGFRYSCHLKLPQIKRTQIPPNKDSIIVYSKPVNIIIKDELSKGRYIGPFSQGELKDTIGPSSHLPYQSFPNPPQANTHLTKLLFPL
jgi:hypothetical protein